MTGLRSYLADIYEQSENIMKATERMRSSWEMHYTTRVSSDFLRLSAKRQSMFRTIFETNTRIFPGERYQDSATG
jgi:hypothetical protein